MSWFDTDGDGVGDVYGVDADGDGYVEQILTDGDGDGVGDTWSVDSDRDGLVDQHFTDQDGDGVLETIVSDADEDGLGDVVLSDTDHDGLLDVAAVDANHNGVFEAVMVDTTGDGNLDTLVQDRDEDGFADPRPEGTIPTVGPSWSFSPGSGASPGGNGSVVDTSPLYDPPGNPFLDETADDYPNFNGSGNLDGDDLPDFMDPNPTSYDDPHDPNPSDF